MDEIVYFTKQYDRGLVGKIVYETDLQPYDGDTVCQIAYLESSRYCLGTEGVSEYEMDSIRDGIADGTLVGLPVFAYVHGGATIRTGPYGCPWDSGQSGFAYCTKERAIDECGSVEKALEVIKAEVRIFDNYLTGEVFGWVLEDENGDTIDSCWGFYGTDEKDYMVSELDATAEAHIRELDKLQAREDRYRAIEAAETAYWAERDIVTLAV